MIPFLGGWAGGWGVGAGGLGRGGCVGESFLAGKWDLGDVQLLGHPVVPFLTKEFWGEAPLLK